MTTLQAPIASVQTPPFGNLTRYILTVKDHEDWIFLSTEYYGRSSQWWDMNFDRVIDHSSRPYYRDEKGWIKIGNQGAVNFEKWETPLFGSPEDVYKLLRACMRRNRGNNKPTPDEQKKIWEWAFDNLMVYEIKFNLHTLTATKTLIDFRKDCCPKNISRVY